MTAGEDTYKVKRVWYLISEGYRLHITLPRCVIMMEDTANLSLMEESETVPDVLKFAYKEK